ncbi:SUKH-4 family immunity protein [Metabacillus sp. RGM 3146]|uniref:SUKH-4 family immunity protein n=1 Tax=Metabacillus sp. RGM 3146 TaxID=3401092 RepID=UPI003B9A6ACA
MTGTSILRDAKKAHSTFREVYGLVRYQEESIINTNLPTETKEFLSIAGMPESAPPFLTFEPSSLGGGEIVINKYEIEDSKFDHLIYLGYTGSNDPICVSEINGEVVCLDYDNNFNSIFINSSVNQFAESLIIYTKFINTIKEINGRQAYLEKNAPRESISNLQIELKRVDENSILENSFWKEEVESYNRD